MGCAIVNVIGKDELDFIYHPIAVAVVVLYEFGVFIALHVIHFGVLEAKYYLPSEPT